jgi:hypothetical protein
MHTYMHTHTHLKFLPAAQDGDQLVRLAEALQHLCHCGWVRERGEHGGEVHVVVLAKEDGCVSVCVCVCVSVLMIQNGQQTLINTLTHLSAPRA